MRSSAKFLAVCLLAMPTAAYAWPTEDFNDNGVSHVPNCSGVYIIERNGDPYYVGRSRVSIRERLSRHLSGNGSRMVASILGGSDKLTVEYECLDSPEQMEAQLIQELGTTNFGNLRRETDPADWDN